jgi:CopG family nickel-responsive transcriptional regulator
MADDLRVSPPLAQDQRAKQCAEAAMERITMSIDEALAKEFDALIAKRGYGSRSEAIRDLLRREIESNRVRYEARSYCVASLSYVYDHHLRDLAERLTAAQHEHHDLVVATMHVHLDHEHCLETTVLKGSTAAVRSLADRIRAERGVRHTAINLITVEPGDKHASPRAHRHQGHMHLIPRS